MYTTQPNSQPNFGNKTGYKTQNGNGNGNGNGKPSHHSDYKPNTAYCKVCHDAGLSVGEYTSHFVRKTRDPMSDVTCPLLLKIECQICHHRGHYSKYCPSHNNISEPISPLQTNTRLDGIARGQSCFHNTTGYQYNKKNSNNSINSSTSTSTSTSTSNPESIKKNIEQWPLISLHNPTTILSEPSTTHANIIMSTCPDNLENNSLEILEILEIRESEYTNLRFERMGATDSKKHKQSKPKTNTSHPMPKSLRKFIPSNDLSWAYDEDEDDDDDEEEYFSKNNNSAADRYYAEWDLLGNGDEA